MEKSIEFFPDNIEIVPRSDRSIKVKTTVRLEVLLAEVSDADLLEIMDIDHVRKWLAGKDGAA